MSKRDYLLRYLLIVKKLRSSRLATFNEINEYLLREFELMDSPRNISLRTFQRDLNEIRTIFNIDIKCNATNQYYIAEEESPGFNHRMMEAFDVINSLNTGQHLTPYVLLEKRCPLGTEHLYGLLHSIRNRYIVRFTYQKYYEPDTTLREVEPYALKEFKGRWYLLSKDYKDDFLKTFGLDRIFELEISKKKFTYPSDLNPGDYFKNCYGVSTSDETETDEVVLSFEPLQGKYIKSYPLHESQEILQDNENELLIRLTLFVNHDLIMELLSYGENVRAVKPDSLIDALKDSYQNALNFY
jgi:predicted DNA-binding transcriptional regulator YafY